LLPRNFVFFDGKHKRAKGYVTLTASVYHPLPRRQIPLATMEAVSENTAGSLARIKIFQLNF